MRRTYSYIIGLMVLLGVIFGLRLGYAKPETVLNDVLTWLIWFGSLGILILFMTLNGKAILSILKQAKDLLIFVSTFFWMEIFFVIKNMDGLKMTYLYGLLLSIFLWVMLYLLLPKKYAKIFGVLSLIIYGSYVIGQDIYVRIFHDYFSFKEALTLREGVESGQSMYRFHFLHPVVILLMIASIWTYLNIKTVTHMVWSTRILKKAITLGLLLFLTIHINQGVSYDQSNAFNSDRYLYQTVYSRETFAKTYGVFHLMGRDLLDTFTPRWHSKKDVEDITAYFEENQKAYSTHDYVGLFEGKNLVFILAESYDEVALDPLLTPHLYRLKTEGFDFRNHYTPVFQRTTSDSEFIFNTSLMPSMEDGPTVTVFKNNTYRQSLANLFQEQGYITSAFHGNYKEFYGRHIIYENYGYHHFYGEHELGLTKETGKFDTLFFDAAKDLILPTDHKFMSFLITFSGHSPYTMDHVVAKEHIEKVHALYPQDPDVVNLYRATQIELDLMIGQLFDTLEEKHLIDDTVVILTGDHYPYTMPQEVYEQVTGITENHLKQKGNLYVWSSDITPRQISQLTTSFDILPTINALFDLKGNPTPYVGQDIFLGFESIVYYKNYAYYDGISYVSLSELQPTSEQMKRIIAMYQLYKKILRTNYFK